VQNLLGIDRQVRQAQRADPGRRNQLSVRLELQADFLPKAPKVSTIRAWFLLGGGHVSESFSRASQQGLSNHSLLVLTGLLSCLTAAQEPLTPWRNDPLFQRLAAALDPVPAIDTHTHLLGLKNLKFDPAQATQGPVLMRSTHPWLLSMIKARFGVTLDPRDWASADESIVAARTGMVNRLGEHGYWMNHLDYTNTEIVLVNSNTRQGTDGARLRWVPHASTLLYPLPADHLMARSPGHKADITDLQRDLRGFLKEADLTAVPADLNAYIGFVDQTLRRWQQQGAVAVKFFDAYLRTLRIAEVPEARAVTLYAKGRTKPLTRDEYIALQDFLWRHIILEAGKIHLPVHIHSSLGVPPFMRTHDSDVRSLDDVLTDPRFFATPVVLIHGGLPWYEIAAYQALKPNVGRGVLRDNARRLYGWK
jgi:hypothetical protein